MQEQELIRFGSSNGLRITLRWRDDYGTSGPVGATWGDLRLWVRDTLVWGTPEDEGTRPLTWSWIELLEQLGPAWRYLSEELGYPINFANRNVEPEHPGRFRAAVEGRWEGMDAAQIIPEDNLMRDFLAVHDLAQGLQGAYPPSVVLLRQGNDMLVAKQDRCWALPLTQTLGTLEQLGEAIAQRISTLADPRSRLAQERWLQRNAISNIERFSIASGWSDERISETLPPANDGDISELGDGYSMAARMMGDSFSNDIAREVFEVIHNAPLGPPPPLDELWQECADLLQQLDGDRPYQQGYALAAAVRDYLEIPGHNPIEPDSILQGWGVQIQEISLGSKWIDAIAVWGPKHGPAILLNSQGARTAIPSGRRSTLAHEIAHLLADSQRALPCVDLLGGHVPKAIEQRANAFSAEFLLPRAVVTQRLNGILQGKESQGERDSVIKHTIDLLANEYGTSHETTVWQAKNAGCLFERDKQSLHRYLNSINSPFDLDE